MERDYKRGDIYFADLGDGIGSEQKGIRPVMIVQNDIGNKYSGTVVVAALTSDYNSKPNLPTHYYIKADKGLYKDSIVMLEQIRTIDKNRIICYIGQASKIQLNGIDKALRLSLGLSKYMIMNLCTDCVKILHSSGVFFIRKDNHVHLRRKCVICKKYYAKPYNVYINL